MSGKGSTSETLEKGLRILDVFRDAESSALSLAQIGTGMGVNKTSVHRYVTTYCQLGYLQRDERTRLYRLGTRALALAHAVLQKSELVRAVAPLADDIHLRHGLHVDVGLLDGEGIHLVYRRQSPDTLAFRSFSFGTGLHYLASGKAALAFMPPAELAQRLERLELRPRTERTITDRQALLADLTQSRERGYARNNEEFVPGLIAIGAPLVSLLSGQVVGGVSFDSSTERYAMEEFERVYAPLLVALAKKISAVASV